MTSKEKWNLIVDGYQRLSSSLEAKIQTEWEMYCAELFGYKKLLHEIDSQRHLSVGSGGSIIPDIILRTDNKDIFDIELKQYGLPFAQTFENQLISYLNQTHLSVGMIVCNKIYLYYYEYSSVTIEKIEISFVKDSEDGIALMDLMSKETFSPDRIKAYIDQKHMHEKSINEIKQQLASDWIKELVKLKLSEKYSKDDIDKALKTVTFKAIYNDATATMQTHAQSSTVTTIYFPKTDISSIIQEWCKTKTQEGKMNFLHNCSNKKYIRFTMNELDRVIPYQTKVKSAWNNGHFYTFQIVNYGDRFKIMLSFNNTNTPDAIQKAYKNIMDITGLKPEKETWQWWSIFATTSFVYDDKTTRKEIFNALDLQFSEIREKVVSLLNII